MGSVHPISDISDLELSKKTKRAINVTSRNQHYHSYAVIFKHLPVYHRCPPALTNAAKMAASPSDFFGLSFPAERIAAQLPAIGD